MSEYWPPPSPTNMTDVNMADSLSTEEALFRPAKRRKFYRRHNPNDDDNSMATSQSTERSTTIPRTAGSYAAEGNSEVAVDAEKNNHFTMAEILRRRQAARNRRGGIEFTNNPSSTMSEVETSQSSGAMVEKSDPAKEVQTVVNRFAPQTGQVADVDKHM